MIIHSQRTRKDISYNEDTEDSSEDSDESLSSVTDSSQETSRDNSELSEWSINGGD